MLFPFCEVYGIMITGILYARGDFLMYNNDSFFKRMAEERGITEEELKEQIQQRIIAGLNSPDSTRRKQWESIPHEGNIPTPEEYIRYVVKKLIAEGREDLLRRYCRKENEKL